MLQPVGHLLENTRQAEACRTHTISGRFRDAGKRGDPLTVVLIPAGESSPPLDRGASSRGSLHAAFDPPDASSSNRRLGV